MSDELSEFLPEDDRRRYATSAEAIAYAEGWRDASDAAAPLREDVRLVLLAYRAGEHVERMEVDRLLAALTPTADTHDPEYLCPNCVTPWKCNGPHIPEGEA